MVATSIVAVVPVAFFTEQHVEMTRAFLDRLREEVDWIGVWHNGGPLASEGMAVMERRPNVMVTHAEGWPFYKMWNEGARWAQEIGADASLFLNNDIDWPVGALTTLAQTLIDSEEDVAAVSPDPDATALEPGDLVDIPPYPAYHGLHGWCFAIRPAMWQMIDERYESWYGDDELGLLLVEAGWRSVRATGIPVHHPTPETTMQYREGIWDLRRADEAIFNAKWINA